MCPGPAESSNVSSSTMVGKVQTVTGPVEPDQLGATIMHEHLFIDLRRFRVPDENSPATDLALSMQKLTAENARLAREYKPITDNWLLADVDEAIEEANEFRYAGGGTIVEVTSIGIRRDPVALRRVARATGLNIVMGAGWYQKKFHPPDMDQRTVEDLAEEIIRDVTVGVGETGIRSGIIGEVGIEGEPLTENEIKSIRASARASMATGAAISFHKGGTDRAEKLRVAGIVGEEGVDPSRVIFGHSDFVADDIDLLLDLLSTGVYVQFDVMGRLGVTIPWGTSPQIQMAAASQTRTTMVAEAIPRLIEAGYAERILLSHDVCHKDQFKRYGGTGYSFVLEKFAPHLRLRGVAETDIRTMLVDNPMRVLPLTEPRG